MECEGISIGKFPWRIILCSIRLLKKNKLFDPAYIACMKGIVILCIGQSMIFEMRIVLRILSLGNASNWS